MCLIAVAWRVHPDWPLVLASNRDEFHARPTLPLSHWDDDPRIVGGRDALHGGGWLALRGARLAAVTNVREGGQGEPDGRSRGALVAGFVSGDQTARDAIAAVAAEAAAYRPFNLLLHDGETLAWTSNRHGVPAAVLAPGVHGLSNGPLGAPWPKVERLRAVLADWLARDCDDDAPLFGALADDAPADDQALPDTGVGLALERMLSPAFIRGPRYGTRASTVVRIGHDLVEVIERRHGPDGVADGTTRLVIPR